MADSPHHDYSSVKLVNTDNEHHTTSDNTTLHRANTNLTTSSRSSDTPPEDDAFDPTKLGEKGDTNLVRGASMRSRSTSPYPGDIKHGAYTDDYYNHPQDESESSLVRNAADVGHSKGHSGNNYEDLEYADPYNTTRSAPVPEKTGPLARFLGGGAGRYPLEQRIEDKKRGIGRQRHPFLVWILTIIMVSVFIYELVVNSREQGSPVSFKPVVNYMLGPASAVLINVGARFPACMKLVEDIPPTFQLGCMNNTANPVDSDKICTVEDICGFGGFHDADPDQWYRFFLPIFIHAGFIHIALNMLAQLTLSAQIEREMGSGGFFFTYFAAGIFGNVFGGNFSLVGVPSVGASGAIFGTVAITWVDLIAHWKYQYRPVRKLIFMIIELCIGIAIGYIPYVDNFAHIGGFLMGLLVGMVFYPVISETKRHKMITWGFRIAALPLAIVLFVTLTRNFYTADPYAACDWCRYLSCWPTSSNDHCHGTGLTTSS